MKDLGLSIAGWLWILALGALLPSTALGDGMVIPTRAYAIPQIPDQQALLHYANGIETLVIETAFVGQGTNFAWVVPLPAVAKIEPASTGLFPTLQTIFQPEVVLKVRHYWIALPIAMFVFWLARLIYNESFFGLLILCLLIVLGAFLVLPLFMRAMSKGGAMGSSLTTSVRVLNRQTAGLFDTVTLKSSDPAALLNWLNDNGFRAPTNMAPVIADYVRANWVFVAARLRFDSREAQPRATHPLVFTFPAAKPVYPLRLTAAGATSCTIDLYVFGPGRAEVPGFKARRCEAPDYKAQQSWPRVHAGRLQVRHQELCRLVAEAPVATKLTASLSPAAMSRDAYVGWGNYRPTGGKVFSPAAALTFSGNVAALLFMALVMGWWLLKQLWSDSPARRWGPWLAPLALAVGVAVYSLGLPKVGGMELRTVRFSRLVVPQDMQCLAMTFGDELSDTNVVAGGITPVRPLNASEQECLLKAAAPDFGASWPDVLPMTNLFTGEHIKCEASPGNILVRPSVQPVTDARLEAITNGYELVWHDLDGAEAVVVPVAHWPH